MTSAIIRGYYGRQNTGDDAFLVVSAWALEKYFGIRRMYATADTLPLTHNKAVRKMYFDTMRRGATRLNRLREHFDSHRAQMIVFGGGSTLQRREDLQHNLQILDRVGNGLSFAAGVGIGPFPDDGAREACGQLLRRLAFVGVRDQISFDRACQIAPTARVELTFDIAPALSMATRGLCSETPQSHRRGLAVVLANQASDRGDSEERSRIDQVAEGVRRCVSKTSVEQVVLIDFNEDRRAGDVVDGASHRQLARQLNGVVPLSHISYFRDPVAAYNALGTVRAALVMRLHAEVFAYCQQIPTVLLSYHEKCAEWAKMIGRSPELVIDAANIDPRTLAEALQRVLASDPPCGQLPVQDALELSLRNWTWPQR